jgi:hypothetical protein
LTGFKVVTDANACANELIQDSVYRRNANLVSTLNEFSVDVISTCVHTFFAFKNSKDGCSGVGNFETRRSDFLVFIHPIKNGKAN